MGIKVTEIEGTGDFSKCNFLQYFCSLFASFFVISFNLDLIVFLLVDSRNLKCCRTKKPNRDIKYILGNIMANIVEFRLQKGNRKIGGISESAQEFSYCTINLSAIISVLVTKWTKYTKKKWKHWAIKVFITFILLSFLYFYFLFFWERNLIFYTSLDTVNT